MNNPIKINLFFSDTCPIDNDNDNQLKKLTVDKVGGNPMQLISKINNDIFKYLNGTYTDNENNRHTIYFKFNDIFNNKKDISGSSYLGRGGLTSVFAIKYLSQDENILPLIQDKNLVIRMFDSFYSQDITEWIKKYSEQKILFGSNLIDIYLYGQVTFKSQFIGFYTITRFYNNHTQIINLDYNQTVNYFNSFLDFIIKVKSNNYYYRDLKFSNVGFDLKDSGECEFIVLDYDDITLTKNTDEFYSQFNSGCSNKYCAGTLIPYFIIKDYLTLQSDWINRFDKVYVVGMVDIMINLFFTKETNLVELLKMIYVPSKYTSCIHYYQYLNLFDHPNNYQIINNFLDNLIPKFTQINNVKKKTLLDIIRNLLSKEYSQINTPELVKQIFYNEIIILPSHIETSTGKMIPIDNIKFIPLDSSSQNTSGDNIKFIPLDSSSQNTSGDNIKFIPLDSSSQNTSGDIRIGLKDIGKQSGGKKLKYFVSNKKVFNNLAH
jgi:hypothetical protein